MLRFTARVAAASWLGCAPALAQEGPDVPREPLALQETPAVDVHRVSVDAAMAVAIETAESIDVASARRDRAEAERRVARASFLPQLAGSVSYQRTFASQFDFEGQAGAPSPFDNLDLPFGQDNTWQVGLAASQDVWSGGAVRANVRLAGAALAGAELEVAQSRAEVALDAAGAFYNAQLADQLVDIASAAEAASARTLEITRLGFEVGVRPEFDVLRAEIEVENQRVTRIRVERQRELAFQRLRQLLDLPEDAVLELVESEVDVVPAAMDLAGVSATDPRIPVEKASRAVDISEAALVVARAQLLPSVRIDAAAAMIAYPEQVIVKDETWREDVTATVGLQVPLYTGGRSRGNVAAAQADRSEARAQLELTQELSDLDTRDSEATLTAARAQWEATGGAARQADRSYQIAEVRFREGLSTQVELTDALLALRQALANRAVAARDLELARLRLALLPALPLGSSSGVTLTTVTTGTQGPSSAAGTATTTGATIPSTGTGVGATVPAAF